MEVENRACTPWQIAGQTTKKERSTTVKQKTLVLDQIEVEVLGFFTTKHCFQTEAGTIGELTFPAFSQYGTFRTVNGRELLMQKPRWLGTSHELVEGKVVRGQADQRGFLSRDFVIALDSRTYYLVAEGAFKQGWFLTDAEGTTLLEFQPRGIFKQGFHVTICNPVDADLVAFAYYLVHVRQQEAAAAGAAAAGAAAAS
jgi:hypothetical protein